MAHVFLISLEVQTEHLQTFLQTVRVSLIVNAGRDPGESFKIKLQKTLLSEKTVVADAQATLIRERGGAPSPPPFYRDLFLISVREMRSLVAL